MALWNGERARSLRMAASQLRIRSCHCLVLEVRPTGDTVFAESISMDTVDFRPSSNLPPDYFDHLATAAERSRAPPLPGRQGPRQTPLALIRADPARS